MPRPIGIVAVDAGSNAIRAAVARVSSLSEITEVATERWPVRLGHNVFTKRRLDNRTIARAVRTFKHFRAMMRQHDVQIYRAVATSAVREAENGEAKTSNMVTHSALPPEETERLAGEIVAALKTVFDPEIPADIYELGLIYKVDIKDDRTVDVEMTLTTPNCPAAGELPTMVENAVASVPGVGVVNVNLVWEPAWSPDRMSDEARLVLNMW